MNFSTTIENVTIKQDTKPVMMTDKPDSNVINIASVGSPKDRNRFPKDYQSKEVPLGVPFACLKSLRKLQLPDTDRYKAPLFKQR